MILLVLVEHSLLHKLSDTPWVHWGYSGDALGKLRGCTGDTLCLQSMR